MSRKLQDFLKMMAREKGLRSETEMGSFVSWLQRRSALLKNLDRSVLVDIMRHATHMRVKRDDVIFSQGQQRISNEQLRFFLFLRGSASMFVNKFLAVAQRKKFELMSSAKTRTPVSPEKMLLAPKSASSKRGPSTRKSPFRDQQTHDEDSDASDAESEVSIETAVEKYADTMTNTFVTTSTKDNTSERPTPISKLSRAFRRETPRAKYGRFVVKYEKGKYFSETAILDDDGLYTASILANELCDILVLDEEFFNKSIKEQHEREATEMLEFVYDHPFFCNLPSRAKGVLQIALRKSHFNTGDFIVRQEDPVERLYFIVSGSAEVIIEPAKHRFQFPDYWPFETSKDIYYNEFEWLRESRRKVYSKKYEQHTESDFRKQPKIEVSLCAVQKKEVTGIIEQVLLLPTHIQSVRCLQPTEIYSLSIKPFNRLIKRRSPDTMDLIRAYVQMKLKFRIEHSLGEKVPLLHSLYVKAEREYREKSFRGLQTKSWEKLRQKEKDMLKLLEWFKLDKAALVNHMDVDVIRLKDKMRKKAQRREKFRQDVRYENPFKRTGCLATVKPDREPMSLRALRDPMNEIILKLKMAGTNIKDEQELEEYLLNYTRKQEEAIIDIEAQTNKVTEEEINLLHYRRRGNKLVRRFLHLLSHKGRRTPLTKEETLISNILLEHYHSGEDSDEERLPVIEEMAADSSLTQTQSRLTSFDNRKSGRTQFDGWRTRKSIASSYRTYQFDRRSITPSALEAKIRNFHYKYGGKDSDVNTLPDLRVYDEFEAEEPPIPGGKVFVTTVPCMSVCKNVHIKNHKHERCQMLGALPMSKVRVRSPTTEFSNEYDDEAVSPTTFRTPTTFLPSATTFRTCTQTTLQSSAMVRSPTMA